MEKSFQFYKIGKILAVILLIVTLCIIGLYFIFKTDKNHISISPQVEKINKPKFQESIVHFEIKGGEKRLFVRGEKHYLGEDGKYHLENNIEIKIFPKKKGEEETIIRAQNATYNQEKTLFILTSNVAIKRGGLTLETQEILFNRKRDVIRAKGEIQFFTDKLKGEGKGLIYFPEDKIIKILANVKGEIERKNEKYPINFQCNRLEYKKEEKKIFLRGKVRIYQHYNGLKANQALLMLSPSEKELKSIKLIKNAKVTLVSEDKKTDELKEIREMKADEILVNFKNEDINFIRGRENCKLKIISEKSVSKEIKAYEIELFINEDQTANFKAIGNVYLKDFEQDREIIGEIVIKDNESFTVFGKGGQNASLSFENNRLSAQKILIKPEENTILAKGKIENIIHPDSAEKSSISFLSPNKNIKISSGEMSYDDGKKSLVFRNNVQLKQGNSLITCEKINFDKKKRIILASGKLRAFLYLEKEKGIITILSEEMEFNDLNRIIIFRKNKFLSLKNLRFSADEIGIFLEKEKEGINSIKASNNVQVSWKEYRAKGDLAQYFPKEEKFVLSGNVLLMEEEKSDKISGTKLTFYLSDDRILMENREGRITSILKPTKK